MPNPFISTVIRCAGPNCDHVKQTTNHWLLLFRSPGEPSIEITGWNTRSLLEYDDAMPLCGDACVIAVVQKFLSDLKSNESAEAKGGRSE